MIKQENGRKKTQSKKDKRKSTGHKQDDQSKVEDDQSKKKTPCLVPRVLPREGYCLSKTINSSDVIPINPELFLTVYKCILLTDSRESKNLVVYDEDNRKYNMLFSSYVKWQFTRYSISADWEIFVTVHNLKAGDEISFYRFLDRDVCDGYYYILKYVSKSPDSKDNDDDDDDDDDDAQNSEKSSDNADQQVEDMKKMKMVLGPGSRPLPHLACCLSKTLTSHEVVLENPKLYFDPNDAIDLTDCRDIVMYPPGTYSKDLLVFDEDDRYYAMTLSHDISGAPETSYCLNTGWSTFLRTHGLKEGDCLVFYRIFDTSVYDQDSYYVLKYFTEPKADKSPHGIKNAQEDGPIAETKPSDGRLEADIAETRRKLQYWMAKKAEVIALLELTEIAEKEHEDRDCIFNEITNENNQSESSKVEDDQSEKKAPGPVPRVLLHEVHCFSRTLNSNEVIPISPELFLEACEARFLTEFPGSKILLVYDEDSRIYNMLLSHYVTWECVQYSISVDWERFLRTHSLKAGDEISFYKILDRNVSDDYYYILKYVRKSQNSEKPSDDAGQQVDDKKMKINEPGPGSRPLTSEFLFLSKTLTSDEVVQENAKLYFDPNDAIILTNFPEIERYPPGTYSKDLMVFDEDGRHYTMNLSHNNTSGACEETSYCLNTGWRAYLRAHNLKEGDRLAFYKFLDTSVYEDYYYVVIYFRKPSHIVDYQFKKIRISDSISSSYKKEGEHSESEPNNDNNASLLSPDKRQDNSKVKDNEVALASLLELRLEAEIEEAERQIEYWKAKKSEAVEVLQLFRVLAKGEHQDGV